MKTISFINQKGGVGKTTLTDNVAHLLATKYNLNVLVVDNDKQGNTTKFFGAKQDGQATITDILNDENQDVFETIQKTRYENIDIIAADTALPAAIQNVLNIKQGCQYDRYSNALGKVKDKYHVCIIDNPPTNDISVLNALIASNEVIVVITPDEYSIDGMEEMQKYIDTARRFKKNLLFRGCVMNQFTKTHESFVAKAKARNNYPTFDSNIRYTKDKINKRQPILEISPTCGFAIDLKKFAEEMIKGK